VAWLAFLGNQRDFGGFFGSGFPAIEPVCDCLGPICGLAGYKKGYKGFSQRWRAATTAALTVSSNQHRLRPLLQRFFDKLDNDGTFLVNPAETVDLPASPSLAFWPCAGYKDTTPSGDIISLDCHAN
jgi:hypothetical protein